MPQVYTKRTAIHYSVANSPVASLQLDPDLPIYSMYSSPAPTAYPDWLVDKNKDPKQPE